MKTICVVLLFILYARALSPPPYYPLGPQTNVPKASLGGWTVCWSGGYNEGSSLIYVLEPCGGDYLLLA